MSFGTRTKFSNYEVKRVGCEVALRVKYDYNVPAGTTLATTISFNTQEEAERFEQLLQHMTDCAEIIGDMPEEVLQATLTLTKGKHS